MSTSTLLASLTTELSSCENAPATDACVLSMAAALSALASQGQGEATAATPGLVLAVLAACASQPRELGVQLSLAKAFKELAGDSSSAGAALLASKPLPLMVAVGTSPLAPGVIPFYPPAVILRAPGGLLALRDALAASPWATAPLVDTSVPGAWLATAAACSSEAEGGLVALARLLQAAEGSANLQAALASAACTLLPSTEALASQALPLLLSCLPASCCLLPYLATHYSSAAWESVGQAARLAAAPHMLAQLHAVNDLPRLLALAGPELLQAWPLLQAELLRQLLLGPPAEGSGTAASDLCMRVRGASFLVPHLCAEARAAASQALSAPLVEAMGWLYTAYSLLQVLSLPAALPPALVQAAEAALAAASVPALASLLSVIVTAHPWLPSPHLQLGAREAALLTAALALSSSSSSSSAEASAPQLAWAVGMAATLAPGLLQAEGFQEALRGALGACLARSRLQPLAWGDFVTLQECWPLLVHCLHASIEAGVPGAAEGGLAAAVVQEALGECLGSAAWHGHTFDTTFARKNLVHCLAQAWLQPAELATRCAQLLRWHSDWPVPGFDSAACLLVRLLQGGAEQAAQAAQAAQAFVAAGGLPALLGMLEHDEAAHPTSSGDYKGPWTRQQALQDAADALGLLAAQPQTAQQLAAAGGIAALCRVLQQGSPSIKHLPEVVRALLALHPCGQQAAEAGRAAVTAVQRIMQWVGSDEGTIPTSIACAVLVGQVLSWAVQAGVLPAVLDEGGVGMLARAAGVRGVPEAYMRDIVGGLEGLSREGELAVGAAMCRAVGGGGGRAGGAASTLDSVRARAKAALCHERGRHGGGPAGLPGQSGAGQAQGRRQIAAAGATGSKELNCIQSEVPSARS